MDLDDIQGHIFPGFGSAHTAVIALRLDDPEPGRIALRPLLGDVTRMEQSLRDKEARRAALIAGMDVPAQPSPSLAIGFSANALRLWGHDTSAFDLSFHEGMFRDAEALGDRLGDDRVPVDWTFGTREQNRADVLLISGHSSRTTLEHAVRKWLDLLSPHLVDVLVEYGRRRPEDKEFFGFHDGISQPAIRGTNTGGEPLSRRVIAPEDPRSAEFARPGQRLVWPGSFIFGYAREVSSPLDPGPAAEPPAPWMRNGSYLVFRRLSQDVEAFQSAVAQLESRLTSLGEDVPEGWVASRLVGRWPDGTPLHASPETPDPAISGDLNRINNFKFKAASPETPIADGGGPSTSVPSVPPDPLGIQTPFMSHVRQVNPRDGKSEIGAERHPAKLMLRRGTPFGPEVAEEPEAERGLLFLSYQTSIVEQFKFVQSSWSNAKQRPAGGGLDPITGQDGTQENERKLRFFAPSRGQRTCPFNGRWVIPTGGEYFAVPGIAGLLELTR
ncbi:MAG: Dyp-type peroxidase [Alphaproteobacteria bacterium]|nr:Dyp-type peroxidase [Alphaproteobacteria bacterium]